MNQNNKASYTILNNMIYLLKFQWRTAKKSVILLFLIIPITVGITLLSVYLPKDVVYNVINNTGIPRTLISLITICIIITILKILQETIRAYNIALMADFRREVTYEKNRKILYTDYENIENPKCRYLLQQANQALWGTGAGSSVERASGILVQIIINIITFCLFASILSVINPYLIIILITISVINYFLVARVHKYQYKNRIETAELDRKLWYITYNSGELSGAKDIRLFNMQSWFSCLFQRLTKERLIWSKKIAAKHFTVNIAETVCVVIRDAILYVILTSMVVSGRISIDNFVLYFGAITSLTTGINTLVNSFIELNQISLLLCDLRDFINYKDNLNRDNSKKVEADLTNEFAIEIKSLSFGYPESEADILKKVSLKIKSGEKIALVGMNGAGKTTLIKIICGFYTVKQGEVKIFGTDFEDYNIYYHYSLFSTVFQEHYFPPVSIADIVSGGNGQDTDARERTKECLNQAGLNEKINSLTYGIDSKLNKQINDDGIDLSGGEKQKLLLARALYKDAPILILDEPSSALDPLAEKELYEKYSRFTQDKTSIFVSHRLASTLFCDRIIYFEDGQIVEEGTHKELMDMNGKYANLFKIQSKYYEKEFEI